MKSFYVYRQLAGEFIHIGLVRARTANEAIKIAKRNFPFIAPVIERKP